ncbi:MAG: DUF3823 domain-containing protein [Chitinophagaceae bacterium]|nr:MAG: DUF3823 domain-containing protein [Chitinophagaceae bacterium]
MNKLSFPVVLCCLMMITGISCSKIDNYPAPSATIQGSVYDAMTDSTVQTEFGGGGTRVKLLETSYSSNPTPEYFQCMQNGVFHDDKIFAATYNISVEGAFVPVILTDDTGKIITDSSKNIILKSTATVNFWVQPFLRIEWVSPPVMNADSSVTVQVRITRGTDNPSYKSNLTDINLYVSNTQNDGNNNYDPRYSKLTSYNGTDGNALLGQVVTITTTGGALPPQDVYFRVGARIASGLNRYNYNAPMTVSK